MMDARKLEQAAWDEIHRLWADQPLDGAHDLAHLGRVLAQAKVIAAREGGDLEVLIPSAILHDAVNVPKSAPDRHRASALSAECAAEFLSQLAEYPRQKIAQCRHAIEAHSFSANIAATSIEAKILQDADRLEALGALGLARMFHVAGQTGGALFDPADPLAKARPLDDRLYSLDHIETKLLPVAAGLHTETARAIARDRVATMLWFRDRLIAEITL